LTPLTPVRAPMQSFLVAMTATGHSMAFACIGLRAARVSLGRHVAFQNVSVGPPP
jgi:hypothetical protein